jgi:hypothetical protein
VAAPGLEYLVTPMGESFPQSRWQKTGRLKNVLTENNGHGLVAR